ncbi:hypothetical protein B0H14DRAFT_2639046 [Mycena olivaceomarginata]|nr:hypothetical protein B0H14DRAFT_2639046 [Mycena olivaceomarginata]
MTRRACEGGHPRCGRGGGAGREGGPVHDPTQVLLVRWERVVGRGWGWSDWKWNGYWCEEGEASAGQGMGDRMWREEVKRRADIVRDHRTSERGRGRGEGRADARVGARTGIARAKLQERVAVGGSRGRGAA